jgi:murein DD-endopeptidase MepM/ murein hydrolase activator NlpD
MEVHCGIMFTLAVPLLAVALVVPAAVHNGDLFIIGQGSDKKVPEAVEFMDRSYPPIVDGEGGVFFLLAVDLQTPPGSFPLVARYEDGNSATATFGIRVKEREFPVERLTLPPKMVTPPPDVLDRIARERAAAAAVYRETALQALWSPPFERPTAGVPSGNFGRRRILNDTPKSPHSGEDYKASRGEVVRAVARGKVEMAEDLYYSGMTVLIDHGAGLVSQYFHLDSISVDEGQVVERGGEIGRVGSTGRVTGPHLHFGIRLFGMRADPAMLWEIFE